MRLWLLGFLFLISFSSFAQFETIYTNNCNNPSATNPSTTTISYWNGGRSCDGQNNVTYNFLISGYNVEYVRFRVQLRTTQQAYLDVSVVTTTGTYPLSSLDRRRDRGPLNDFWYRQRFQEDLEADTYGKLIGIQIRGTNGNYLFDEIIVNGRHITGAGRDYLRFTGPSDFTVNVNIANIVTQTPEILTLNLRGRMRSGRKITYTLEESTASPVIYNCTNVTINTLGPAFQLPNLNITVGCHTVNNNDIPFISIENPGNNNIIFPFDLEIEVSGLLELSEDAESGAFNGQFVISPREQNI